MVLVPVDIEHVLAVRLAVRDVLDPLDVRVVHPERHHELAPR
jgi:hypothetical protein